MFLRVCALSRRHGRCQGLLAAQPAGVSLDVVCIPSTQRSEAQFLCACVCANHSNSSTGLQHQQQQHQCSSASVVASPGTEAGKPCSCCCGGYDVSHSRSTTVSNTVHITLSGKIMQSLFITLKLNFLYISGELGRKSSTVFGSLTLCRYTYSYHNNRYIIEQGDMTCLRSSKRSLKPSKTKYPLGKHSNNIMPYKIIPRYGLRAIRHNAHSWGTFWFRFFEMYYKITGSLAKLDR